MEFKTLALGGAELKFADNGESFTGYASVFGGVDSYGDTIHPGAFTKAIGDGAEVKMYFNHRWKRGDLPIGKMYVKQDERGLHVDHAEFTKGLRAADETALALRHGTVTGLSIAYALTKEGSKPKTDGRGRDVHEITFLKEVSVVDWPADSAAQIDLKSSLEQAESLRDIEGLLRDAADLSRSEATALVSRIRSLAHGDRVAESQTACDMRAILQRELG